MGSYLQCVTWTCTVWAGKRLPLPPPAVRGARPGEAQCGGARRDGARPSPARGGAAAAAAAPLSRRADGRGGRRALRRGVPGGQSPSALLPPRARA